MRNVVITGASTGIGEECALRLCRMGWRVFAGVRRQQDADTLQGKAGRRGELIPIKLDITDAKSIAGAAQVVTETIGEQGLDGLVNNAGVVIAAPLEFLPVDDFREQLEVNVTGQLAVTQAFLPLLRKAEGRIVFMGSVSGRITTPTLGAYCASKFALDALCATLRMELSPWGMHVAYIGPGGIATPIWRKALNEADRMIERLPAQTREYYGPVMDAMLARASSATTRGLPVEEVGRAVAHALASSSPRTRYVIGTFAQIAEVLRLLPDKIRERILLSQLKK